MLNKLIKFKNSLSRVNRYLELYPKHIPPSSKDNIHRVVIFFSCTNTVRMLSSQDNIYRVILIFLAQIHRACWTSWLNSRIVYPQFREPKLSKTYSTLITGYCTQGYILFFLAQIHCAFWTSWLSSTIVYSRSGDNPNYPKHIQLSSQDNIHRVILFFLKKYIAHAEQVD